MITEDYVSFETAKLLKKYGFDEPSRFWYDNNGIISQKYIDVTDKPLGKDTHYPCVTISFAMKWLREKHNLCIEPYRTACGYLCTISKIPSGSEMYSQDYEGNDESSGQFTTFEKACEAAIQYCLENLIK